MQKSVRDCLGHVSGVPRAGRRSLAEVREVTLGPVSGSDQKLFPRLSGVASEGTAPFLWWSSF